MSYLTVRKGKLGSVSLPSNPPGHAGSMRMKPSKQHPLGAKPSSHISSGGHSACCCFWIQPNSSCAGCFNTFGSPGASSIGRE